MRKPKRERKETAAADLAKLRRAVERASADKHAEAQAAVESSARDAEMDSDLFRFDLAYRLRARICLEPRSCKSPRCRRLGRCRELLKIGRLREAHRARVAGEGVIAGKRSAHRAAKTQRNH
jgi:hypothetical protein